MAEIRYFFVERIFGARGKIGLPLQRIFQSGVLEYTRNIRIIPHARESMGYF